MEADINSLEKGTGDNISLLEEQISAIEKRNEENEETITNTLNNDKITKLERRIYFFFNKEDILFILWIAIHIRFWKR